VDAWAVHDDWVVDYVVFSVAEVLVGCEILLVVGAQFFLVFHVQLHIFVHLFRKQRQLLLLIHILGQLLKECFL